MKKHRSSPSSSSAGSGFSPLESLPEEILFLILSRLPPAHLKPLSLASRTLHSLESRHRKSLTPLTPALLPAALARYRALSRLDFTRCPRVPDRAFLPIAAALRDSLLSVDLSRSRGFGRPGLEWLVAGCRNLVEIDLGGGVELRDRDVAAIGGAGNLERLSLARCKLVTDLGVGRIAVGCAKLKALSLKWCFGVSDLGVELVALKCRKLRSLDVSYVPITSRCLPAILQLLELEELALAGCLGIDDDCLIGIKQVCRSLQVLNLSSCPHISHLGLSSLTIGASNLRELILSYSFPITHCMSTNLRELPGLLSIKLDGCQITSDGLLSIGNNCAELRELSLSKCSGVSDEALSFLMGKHKKLEKIDITCCRNITYASIASITASCTSLTSLKMESCHLVSKEAFVLIGQRCRHLEELDLTDSELDNEGLQALSHCSKLSSLKIGICLNIGDEGLLHIGKYCKEIRELDLYRSITVTDIGIEAIARGCTGLQAINLAYCTNITDNSLRSLSKCPMLNTLEIRGCSQVTSEGLSSIAAGCQQIAKLDIKNCCNMNDLGMLSLARFSQNLRQINLSYCSITDVGLLSLASISGLQSMTVLHARGLTANGLMATFLACGGLIKVKLHSSFKSLLPHQLIEHVQARGCFFQWKDKVFEVEVKPVKVWKQQSADFYNVVY